MAKYTIETIIATITTIILFFIIIEAIQRMLRSSLVNRPALRNRDYVVNGHLVSTQINTIPVNKGRLLTYAE